ncbi:MAG: hypothetical protein D4R43_02750 [Sphingobacteriales bacterium]|nr:MAG: hypothetical protein D4R43_02750 [Sphingobacteriales bacterium]
MNNFQNNKSPIVVGGVGGSGTRVVAQMLMEAGVYIGDLLNDPKDNLWFTLLLRRPQLVKKNNLRAIEILLEIFRKRMFNEKLSFIETLKVRGAANDFILNEYVKSDEWYTFPISTSRSLRAKKLIDTDKLVWGWKEPNTLFFIPQLAKKFPEMKYLLLIRNGLDMAFTDNKVQIRNLGNYFGVNGNSLAHSLEFWIRANNKAIEDGKKYLGKRFKVLQMEELCNHPKEKTKEFLKWAGLECDDLLTEKISLLPKTPSSTNRYKEKDLSIFSKQQLQSVQQLGYNISI